MNAHGRLPAERLLAPPGPFTSVTTVWLVYAYRANLVPFKTMCLGVKVLYLSIYDH